MERLHPDNCASLVSRKHIRHYTEIYHLSIDTDLLLCRPCASSLLTGCFGWNSTGSGLRFGFYRKWSSADGVEDSLGVFGVSDVRLVAALLT